MPDPRDLLICLLDYIKEQAKQINPAAYRLANAKGFQRQRGDMAGLPGVEFDIKVAGDHVWLRVPRQAAEPPPPLRLPGKGFSVSAPTPMASLRRLMRQCWRGRSTSVCNRLLNRWGRSNTRARWSRSGSGVLQLKRRLTPTREQRNSSDVYFDRVRAFQTAQRCSRVFTNFRPVR